MHSSFLSAVSDGVAALLLVGAVAWVSYLSALALVRRGPTSARLAATAVVAGWFLTMVFWLLIPWGAFRLWVVLPLWVGAALVAHRLDRHRAARRGLEPGSGALAADLARLVGVARSLARRPAGWLGLAVAAVAAVRTVRGLALPPMGWDSMTYHLLKAGRWVQSGGQVAEAAPDAWSYYEHYPVVGDLFWAWVMLPFSGDLALALGGLAWWLALLLGIYATARALGAERATSLYGALAVGAMPAAAGYLASAYVDTTTAALFALGSVFVVRILRPAAALDEVGEGGPTPVAEAPLAAAALALMLGTKLTTAGLFTLAGLFVVARVVAAHEVAPRTRRLALVAALAVTVAGVPSYQRAWVEEGSPFYPFRVVVGGAVLSEGAPAAVATGAAIAEREGWWLEPGDVVAHYLWRRSGDGSFLNFGLGLPVLALLGLAGLPLALARRRSRWGAVYLALAGTLVVAGFLSSNMEAFRTTIKATTAGRYLLALPIALAALAAVRPAGRLLQAAWWAAVLPALWLAWPSGWRWEVEARAVLSVAAWSAGAVLVTVGAAWAVRRARGRATGGDRAPELLAALAVLLAVGVAAAGIDDVRAEHRYTLYAAAAERPALYQMHPMSGGSAAAWPIWRTLDDGEPQRLAVTAGWDGLGHNWYRYPLLGSELENEAFYVPVTEDGSIVDYRLGPEVAARGSFPHWLVRLVEERVDFVVSLAPRWTIEERWMRAAPDLFEPVLTDERNLHALWRFDRGAAERLLAGSGGSAPPSPDLRGR